MFFFFVTSCLFAVSVVCVFYQFTLISISHLAFVALFVKMSMIIFFFTERVEFVAGSQPCSWLAWQQNNCSFNYSAQCSRDGQQSDYKTRPQSGLSVHWAVVGGCFDQFQKTD